MSEIVTVPEVSVVIPCLNEAPNAEAIAAAVLRELEAADASAELIFIDNGSTDGTVDIVKALCARDRRVRLIVNTRNFGQMRSPTHGIYQASGRAVIGMCADFQDPPTLLGEFIRRWRAGAQIVLAVRRSERMPLPRRIVRALGYGLVSRWGDYAVIPGATGFGLYDRRVVDALARLRDPEPFFRGMLVESGYALETIPFDRPPRAAGEAKNNLASLFSFGISGLASSARRLLRAPIYLGLALAPLAVLTVLAGLGVWLFGDGQRDVLLFGLGLSLASPLFFFLGLLGEQVRQIAEMVRGAPLVVERERVNFPD